MGADLKDKRRVDHVGTIDDMVWVRGGVVVVHAEEHGRDLLHSTVVKDNRRN